MGCVRAVRADMPDICGHLSGKERKPRAKTTKRRRRQQGRTFVQNVHALHPANPMVISLLFGTVDICSPRPLALRSCACWSTFLLWKVPVVIEFLFCKLMVGLSLA